MKNRVFKKHEFRFISIWLMKHSDTGPWELYSEHILNAVNTWAFHDTSIILAVLTKKFNFIVKFIFFMFCTKKHKSFRFFRINCVNIFWAHFLLQISYFLLSFRLTRAYTCRNASSALQSVWYTLWSLLRSTSFACISGRWYLQKRKKRNARNVDFNGSNINPVFTENRKYCNTLRFYTHFITDWVG